MKKALLILFVAVFIISEAAVAYAETPAFRKFRRGFCNILTFYMEVGHQMNKAANEGGTGKAVTLGLVDGLVMAGGRAIAGVYEFLTFPLPLPPNYEAIMKDPEFFWTEPFRGPETVE